jgi:hypothetical protein
MRIVLPVMVIIVYLLHQDIWFWSTPYPLVFGFMPIGLFYHVCYTLLASLLMLLLLKRAWPTHLELTASPPYSTEDEAH